MSSSTSTHETRQSPGFTLAILSVAALAFALAQTSIVPALGSMAEELNTSSTNVAWTLSGYLVAAAVFTPVVGRLGDIVGKRKMLIVALIAFMLGSLLAAVATNVWMVVAGRVVMGVGGGIFPLCFGIIRDEFPAHRVPGSIGLMSAIAGIGGGAGLVLGGVITDHASYHWIFWLSVVVAAVSALAALAFIPESPNRTPGRIDVAGAVVLAVGLSAPLIAISEGQRWGWGDARTIGLIIAGLVVLALWVLLEQRTAEPLVHIPTLAQPTVLMTNIATLFIGFGMFGAFVLLPQIAQAPESTGYGFGVDATRAGLLLLPGSLMMLVAGPLSGALGKRFGAKYALALGALVTTAGLVLLRADHGSQGAVIGYAVVAFAGIGLAFAALPNLVIEAVSAQQTGQATGVNALVRSVGSSLGSQITASILAGSVTASTGGLPSASSFDDAFVLGAIISVAALALALAIPRARRTDTELDTLAEIGAAAPLGAPALTTEKF